MIEKIYNKKKLYALIVRAKFRKKKGISFFTPNETNQQFGYMKHDKGKLRKVLVIGSLLPLVIYLLWQVLILGIKCGKGKQFECA